MSQIAKFLQVVYTHAGFNATEVHTLYENANFHLQYWNESPEAVYDKEMWIQTDYPN